MGRGGKQRNRRPDRRFPFLLLAFVIALSVVALRLVWVQGVSSATYTGLAEKQRLRDITLSPWRGAIYDREGEPLAVSLSAKTIYAVPHSVKDKKSAARALARVLGGKARDYEKKLSHDSSFVYIARKVDVERAAALEKLEIAGLGFLDDSRRVYPSGQLAGQLLGFVGVDDQGLAGLERYYDNVLAGTPGRLLAERDPFGRHIPGGVVSEEKPVDGRDIQLTIDKDIQYQAQLELDKTVKDFGAKGGSVIVMDPRDGEIYAMASAPNFDPNHYSDAEPAALRLQPAQDAYEPGSTIKSMTAAAVIEENIYKPSSMFRLPPTLQVGGRTIHESHARGTVNWSLKEIVTESSNVGAVKLGIALGKRGIYNYFKKFGLTEKTGIDYPGEAKGWLPTPNLWSASSIGNIPFGQGISVTPLQLARAMSALANGGELPTPHLLASVEGSDAPTWARRRAVSNRTVRQMRGVLEGVVEEGTGKEAAVPGYTVAGKTGTAQVARTDGLGYAPGKYVASFSGFLPAEDPRLLILVAIYEPRGNIYGGSVAAPAFSHIAQFAVAHLKIPPSPPRRKATASGTQKATTSATKQKTTTAKAKSTPAKTSTRAASPDSDGQ